LVRLLIGLGIGIPILVEGLTFLGLIDRHLFDDDGDGRNGATPTPTRQVGVGDELLPETPQPETVRELLIIAADEPWQFTMSVAVENTADVPYELRLGEVTLNDGTTVQGGGSTGRIPPGEDGTAAAQWSIPPGSTPRTVEVIGTTYAESARVAEADVHLSKVPVQGG
jgi:hypothetical protein